MDSQVMNLNKGAVTFQTGSCSQVAWGYLAFQITIVVSDIYEIRVLGGLKVTVMPPCIGNSCLNLGGIKIDFLFSYVYVMSMC